MRFVALFSLSPNAFNSFPSRHLQSTCFIQTPAHPVRLSINKTLITCVSSNQQQSPPSPNINAENSNPRPTIQSHFDALCADLPLPSPVVSDSESQELPPAWPSVLHALSAASIIGSPLTRLTTRLGLYTLLRLCPSTISNILYHLKHTAKLTHPQRTRVITRNPHLLQLTPPALASTLKALCDTGLSVRDVRRIILRFPQVLLISAAYISRVATYLTRPPASFQKGARKALLKRAPWLLKLDIETKIAPAINWLEEFMGAEFIATVVAANPGLLATKRRNMTEVRLFLLNFVGFSEKEATAILRSFPALLSCPVEGEDRSSKVSDGSSNGISRMKTSGRQQTQLETVYSSSRVNVTSLSDSITDTLGSLPKSTSMMAKPINSGMKNIICVLRTDAGLSPLEIRKGIRAFPALLTLSISDNIQPVLLYLREVANIRNVARVVTRLPPILGYDIDTTIDPKMTYLLNNLKLSTTQILMFPAVFSYSLRERIIPRTRFLLFLRIPISTVGLNIAISLTDEQFCQRVAKVPLKSYQLFIDFIYGPVEGSAISGNNRGKKKDVFLSLKGIKKQRANIKSITKRRRCDDGGDVKEDGKGKAVNAEERNVADFEGEGVVELDNIIVNDDFNLDNSKDGRKKLGEGRVWGKKRFRTTLATKIPWSELT